MSAPRVSETIRLASFGLLTCLVLAAVPATALGEEVTGAERFTRVVDAAALTVA